MIFSPKSPTLPRSAGAKSTRTPGEEAGFSQALKNKNLRAERIEGKFSTIINVNNTPSEDDNPSSPPHQPPSDPTDPQKLSEAISKAANCFASEEMRSAIRTSNGNAQETFVTRTLRDYDLEIQDPMALRACINSICSTYVDEAGMPQRVEMLTRALKCAIIIPSLNNAIQKVFKDAETVFKIKVFISKLDYGLLEKRAIGKGDLSQSSIFDTRLANKVKASLDKAENSTARVKTSHHESKRSPKRTILVGGASGGGKTVAVLSLAQGMTESNLRSHTTKLSNIQALVYALPDELKAELDKVENYEKTYVKEAGLTPTQHRDNLMVDLLKGLVQRNMGEEGFAALQQLPEEIKCTLIVALDEIGKYSACVRAMCSISEQLAVALKLPEHVSVQLVAAGTGVGKGEEPPGSYNETYKVHLASKQDNLALFYMHYSDKVDVNISADSEWQDFYEEKPIKDSFVLDMINGNARMAAILGNEVGKAKRLFGSISDEDFIRSVDLVPFLTTSAISFKNKNGLEHSTAGDMRDMLVLTLRMHFFPYKFTRDDKLEYKYGLVIDTARWCPKDEVAKTNSVPTDAVGPSIKKTGCQSDLEVAEVGEHEQLQALKIENNKKSLKIGPGNERVFVYAASKYSRYDLPAFSISLLALLTGRSPVTESVISGQAFEQYWLSVSFLLACAACGDELFGELLSHNGGCLRPMNEQQSDAPKAARKLWAVIVDLSAEMEPRTRSNVKATTDKNPKTDKGTFTNYIEGVKATLSKRFTNAKEKNEKNCCIAAIGSPDKLPFADSILFVDNTLFVFHTKVAEGMDVDLERWKLGDLDDAAITAYLRDKFKKNASAICKILAHGGRCFKGLVDAVSLKRITGKLKGASSKDENVQKGRLEGAAGKIAALRSSFVLEEQVKLLVDILAANGPDGTFEGLVQRIKEAKSKLVPNESEEPNEDDEPNEDNTNATSESDSKPETKIDYLKSIAACFRQAELVCSLAEVWQDTTGIEIKKVKRVFVTPEPYKDRVAATPGIPYMYSSAGEYLPTAGAKDTEGVAFVATSCVFVSTNELRFLRFRPKHSRPLLINASNSIPKHGLPTHDDAMEDI